MIDIDATWYALVVAQKQEGQFIAPDPGRCEMQTARALHQLGLMTVVPQEFRTVRIKGKNNQPIISTRSVPIIPGYVFVGTKRRDIPWPHIKRLMYVHGWVTFDGINPAKLSDADVDAVRRLATERREPSGLSIGDKGRIRRGPFRELEAVLRQIRPDALRVSVYLFGSEREMPISVDNFERE